MVLISPVLGQWAIKGTKVIEIFQRKRKMKILFFLPKEPTEKFFFLDVRYLHCVKCCEKSR